MLCFRDMTFCDSDCVNKTCVRLLTPELRSQAESWWNPFGLKTTEPPIALADFREGCADYKPPQGEINVKQEELVSARPTGR